MDRSKWSLLLLTLALDSVCASPGFFISAPKVFHVNVKEKVFVQSSSVTTLYLEDERTNKVVSDIQTAQAGVQTVELMIDMMKMSSLEKFKTDPYLLLVAEGTTAGNTRSMTRVLVSMHRGYLFIQTNQPIYKPSDQVRYRIFTLDHSMRPLEEPIQISVFNPSGNRLHLDKSLWLAYGGMSTGLLHLPDTAGLGTWKIEVHYEGDEKNAVTQEFEVQKFVLPSFEVTLNTDEPYILLERETFHFTVKAKYTYGEPVNGSYHSWFRAEGLQGSEQCLKVTQMIRGLEQTGSIKNGEGAVTLQATELKRTLQNSGCNLSSWDQATARLVMSVSVTEQQSSELQQAEISLPIASDRYEIDLSRTRSYFMPGAPLKVVVFLRRPDGSPAADVDIDIHVPALQPKERVVTNQEGAAFALLSVPASPPADLVVKVTAEDVKKEKALRRVLSLNQHYLYSSVPDRKIKAGQHLPVTFHIINGVPKNDVLYYLILSHGVLVDQGSLSTLGQTASKSIKITAQMVPSLRLVSYYYNQQGDIISDSLWVDVDDECETKVKIQSSQSRPVPGGTIKLDVEVKGKARVALAVVDTAMYALNRHNKLTAKKVFSAMESYDQGCSYGGGSDSASTFTNAGLSFVSSGSPSPTFHEFGCEARSSQRARRSVDLQHELLAMKWNLSAELQQCCLEGFSPIPMRRSCKDRMKRVSEMKVEQQCAEVFLNCCLKGEALRQSAEDDGLGRTVSPLDIEEYFISHTATQIRRNFAPSFSFTFFDVTDKHSHSLSLPDSITTWEIQAVMLSPAHGFCVVEPLELTAFKDIFVSVRLPYSVRIYEQMSIVAVIYNYGFEAIQLAAHMEQTPGLCSPGSARVAAFVNVSLEAGSSAPITFSAVPMMSGPVPIKIRLFDVNNNREVDAIEKSLNVWTEGQLKTKEMTMERYLDGRTSLNIDGKVPDGTVPGSTSNIFIKVEGAGFGHSSARALLSAKGVNALLELPSGCAEQTMQKMAPTVLALRYLDMSQQWVQLPAGTRDQALRHTEAGLMKILTYKKKDGSYGVWQTSKSSHWLTALIVKVLSLLAERQAAGVGQRGQAGRDVTNKDLSESVQYLLSMQKPDGSFSDPHPVMVREATGGVTGEGKDAAMTAFITVALKHGLSFVPTGTRSHVEAGIIRATTYLLSHVKMLDMPFAVAITAYCLAFCLPNKQDAKPAWQQLQLLATLDNSCRVWKANPKSSSQNDAITVETTAYALLTAVAHQDLEWAHTAACWLVAQENYGGGFKSTQDTIVALEALAEYDVMKPPETFNRVEAEFFVEGRSDKVQTSLTNPQDRVEVELKSMMGKEIQVELRGKGRIKMKVMKHFYLMEPMESCASLNIEVKVEGKALYTSKLLNSYQYFDENYEYDEDVQQQTHTRRRRDSDQRSETENSVMYHVCVSLRSNLSGMAIADITLLSGFEAKTDDLDRIKGPVEQYISHYEISYGRVILYFNEINEENRCITFEAKQTVPISVLQPAPASFYDYYEPDKKCTIFYSAPKRNTEVSKLCSDDVCQCAERPCHTVKNLLTANIRKGTRLNHACFHPMVDYKFVVEVLNVSFKSNFRLYSAKVLTALKSTKDRTVATNSIRVFANRLQCREKLQVGKKFFIMGKDSSTVDSKGKIPYLLESDTWVELVPDPVRCESPRYKQRCKTYHDFTSDFNDCRL